MKYLLSILVVIICCSCSLDLANGMLAYDTGDTRLGMARTSIVTGDGYKRTDVLVDTKGPVGARVSDDKVVLIHQILSATPGTFTREYLIGLDKDQLQRLVALVEREQ